jgi:phosphate starvation-inducible PhoH-like protein
MGSREKTKISREINDGINEYQKNKIMKRSSLSRESFQNTTKSIVLTDKQNELYKSIRNNILTVVHGPAGTSKTFTSCYTALSLLADKKIEQIIITKPNVESGPSLGLLPGTIEEKIDPYKQSYYTNFCKILDKQTVDFLFSTEEIKFEPLSYMRGSTYDNCFMMLDECQN